MATPRADVRAAFTQVIRDGDLPLGITVHERMPYEGAAPRSVVLTLISGSSGHPAIGNRISETVCGLEERFRLQVDCYHDDQGECEELADAVEQTIMDNLDMLATDYDIHDINKVADIDAPPAQSGLRESRILMEFTFYTHRTIA